MPQRKGAWCALNKKINDVDCGKKNHVKADLKAKHKMKSQITAASLYDGAGK